MTDAEIEELREKMQDQPSEACDYLENEAVDGVRGWSQMKLGLFYR
jgi:hypothetical protein